MINLFLLHCWIIQQKKVLCTPNLKITASCGIKEILRHFCYTYGTCFTKRMDPSILNFGKFCTQPLLLQPNAQLKRFYAALKTLTSFRLYVLLRGWIQVLSLLMFGTYGRFSFVQQSDMQTVIPIRKWSKNDPIVPHFQPIKTLNYHVPSIHCTNFPKFLYFFTFQKAFDGDIFGFLHFPPFFYRFRTYQLGEKRLLLLLRSLLSLSLN